MTLVRNAEQTRGHSQTRIVRPERARFAVSPSAPLVDGRPAPSRPAVSLFGAPRPPPAASCDFPGAIRRSSKPHSARLQARGGFQSSRAGKASGCDARAFQALGAGPTPINFNEVHSALQTKIIEGQENPLAIIATAKLYEAQKYCSLTSHVCDAYLILANLRERPTADLSWRTLRRDAGYRACRARSFETAAGIRVCPSRPKFRGPETNF